MHMLHFLGSGQSRAALLLMEHTQEAAVRGRKWSYTAWKLHWLRAMEKEREEVIYTWYLRLSRVANKPKKCPWTLEKPVGSQKTLLSAPLISHQNRRITSAAGRTQVQEDTGAAAALFNPKHHGDQHFSVQGGSCLQPQVPALRDLIPLLGLKYAEASGAMVSIAGTAVRWTEKLPNGKEMYSFISHKFPYLFCKTRNLL